MTPEEEQALATEITLRDKGAKHQVKRGSRHAKQRASSSAWRCEGRWQCAGQMDIWQCIEETERGEAA